MLFTGLGAGNIGDEAMFLAFVKNYRLPPTSTVEVYDPASPVIKTLPQKYQYVDWKDDAGNNQLIASSRAVILAGGTPVASEWGVDWPLSALANRLCFCHVEKIPVHAVGVGVDFLHSKVARQIFTNAFLPIVNWTVRASSCRSALLDLGVSSEKIAVASDLAWLFSPDISDRYWARDFWKSLNIDVARPLIGVNVVNERWLGPTEVKKAIAAALDRVIRKNKIQVVFLCNETRDGEYFDAHAAREVMGMMAEKAVLAPNEYFTPSQMIALLSFCALTVSQRYHFTVFSILAETVALSFSRGQKMAALIGELNETSVGTMEACNPDELEARIEDALINRAIIFQRQTAAAERQKQRAPDNFRFIVELGSDSVLPPRLASVAEFHLPHFRAFMDKVNAHARLWGLREFTNWSKIWEYPWLWFGGLSALDWSGLSALDLGSELSPMPWFLANMGATTTLIERTDQWLPHWSRLANDTGLKVDWRIVEDEKLPFPADSFDVVTSFSVIEHQQNKKQAIEEVARVLKPGGMFAISFDICEPDMGMTFPEWNGQALTIKEFEELVLKYPAFVQQERNIDWNIGDCAEFVAWNLQSAPYHNYTVGAAILFKR